MFYKSCLLALILWLWILLKLGNFCSAEEHWQVTVPSYCCIILAALSSSGGGIWSRFWRRFCLIAQDTNCPFGHSKHTKHGFSDCSTCFCVLETLRKVPYSSQTRANQSILQALDQHREQNTEFQEHYQLRIWLVRVWDMSLKFNFH